MLENEKGLEEGMSEAMEANLQAENSMPSARYAVCRHRQRGTARLSRDPQTSTTTFINNVRQRQWEETGQELGKGQRLSRP